jgi:hypothetical protein
MDTYSKPQMQKGYIFVTPPPYERQPSIQCRVGSERLTCLLGMWCGGSRILRRVTCFAGVGGGSAALVRRVLSGGFIGRFEQLADLVEHYGW